MRGRICVGVFVMLSAAGAEAAGEQALSKPAFRATPAELRAAARSAPAGDWPVVILRDQSEVSFDDAGRATVRRRRVFVVRTKAAVAAWGTIRATWRPSYQDRPAIRARVIGAGGDVVDLEPALATDAPVTQVVAGVSSDLRRIEAPLPLLHVGDVVEQEIATTDREAIVAGAFSTTLIGNAVPTVSTVIAYSAPISRKAHHVARKVPAGARARHEVAAGRERWVYELAALPARSEPEAAMPGDVVWQPYIGVATAASWAAVAREFGAAIDQRIAGGSTSLPVTPRAATIEVVRAIAAWFHGRVHYTAIPFGEGSYLPRPPAETMRRRFGDAGDKAIALIALLRQAGIRADLALLKAAPEREIDPDLPGVGAFDHAIVRAQVGGRDVWIDPIEEMMRPGELPARDQGRAALVIADDTTGLSTTPAAPADNLVREILTFAAAERGPARLTKVTRATGVFEGRLRGFYHYTRRDELEKGYAGEARWYGGVLDHFATSDVTDLEVPLELTLEVEGVQHAVTSGDSIDVYLYPLTVLAELPQTIVEKSAAPRTSEFAWFIPHAYEIENRIVVPPGFTLPAASSGPARAIGPATFRETRRLDGRTLIVTFRFDSGKPRLSATEFTALQLASRELRDEVVHIQIERTASALSRAGKPREAIAECERLIALHPAEALHHDQLAQALLAVGAGEAARREARKAVALAPREADPQAVLGWVLTFDTLGRRFTYDWDRAGAIAAYREARKLDPGHVDAADSLGEILVRDEFGRRYESSSADLRGAVEARRAALALARSDEHALGLAWHLTFAGEFAEAEQLARGIAQSKERDRVIVVAVAGTRGAKAAIQVAGELRPGDGRNELIDLAAEIMMAVQRYDVGSQMLAETGTLAKPGAFGGHAGKLARHPDLPPRITDPRTAVDALLVTLVDSRQRPPVFWDAALSDEFRRFFRFFRSGSKGDGWLRYFEDTLRSVAVIQIEGEAGLWRAAIDLQGRKLAMYLVLEQGEVKLIGTAHTPSGLGRYLLRTAGAAGDARGRRLLDWLRADIDAAVTTGATFKKLWGSGLPSSREAVLLAAAVLAENTDPDRAIEVGARCPSTPLDAAIACHDVLRAAYRARARWADASTQLEAIIALDPARATTSLEQRVWLLGASGRLAAADKLVDDALTKAPDSYDALVARMEAAEGADRLAEAVRRSDAVVDHAQVSPEDLNNVAWLRLFAGGDLHPALALARRSADARQWPPTLNTLAAIEAELGDLDAAVHHNWQTLELHGLPEPSPSDWYVVGRIHEQLGLTADAAAIYKRIPKATAMLSVYVLAQRRLAAMARPR